MSAPSPSYLSASVWLTVLPLLCALLCAPTPGPPVFEGRSTTYVFALPGLAPFLVPVIPLLSFPVSVVSQFGLEYSNTSCLLGTFSLQLQSSLSLPVMRIFKYNNNSSNKEFPKFYCPAWLLKLTRRPSTLFSSITPLMCTACTIKSPFFPEHALFGLLDSSDTRHRLSILQGFSGFPAVAVILPSFQQLQHCLWLARSFAFFLLPTVLWSRKSFSLLHPLLCSLGRCLTCWQRGTTGSRLISLDS